MKRQVAIFVFAALLSGIAYGQETQRQRLEKHLYTLAADSLRGREAGTADGHRAANYIRNQWRQMGLQPFVGDSYDMPFHYGNNEYGYCNLVAFIEGSDPALKDEYIVVGAHYDHVGTKGDKIYNGADDNASGSACLLEMARQLQARRGELKRSVVICAFDAEEKGLYGSKELVRHLRYAKRIDRIKLMLSVDMVGWYKANGELELQGSSTLKDSKSRLAPDRLGSGIKVRFKPFENSWFTATDTEPFAKEGIPTLAVTTGLKSPYHKPEDDANLIDYEGLDKITDYLVGLTVAAARQEGKLASGHLAKKHRTQSFDFGLSAGFNTSYLAFPDATFVGKACYGFQGGLLMQYNFNQYLSLRAKAVYDYSRNPLPYPDYAYGTGYKLRQHSLLVPVTMQMGISEMGTGISFGLGLYYGYAFNGEYHGIVPAVIAAYNYSVDPNQIGFVWDLSIRMGGHWQLDGTWYYQFFSLFDTSSGQPRARKNTYAVTLSYCF